eukprot:2379221-Rhodomonas_salina.2
MDGREDEDLTSAERYTADRTLLEVDRCCADLEITALMLGSGVSDPLHMMPEAMGTPAAVHVRLSPRL